jgi:hypothetical protein
MTFRKSRVLHSLQEIEPWLAQLLSLCTLHSLPCVLYVALSPSTTLRAKALGISAFALLLAARRELAGASNVDLLVLCLALAYFACATVALAWLGGKRVARTVLAPIGLAATLLIYVFVPAWVVPRELAVPCVVIGWELMFSGYSYFRSVARGQATPSQAHALFFVLVDPTLVYARRAVRSADPVSPLRAGARVVLGLLALALALAFGLTPTVPHALVSLDVSLAYTPFATAYGLHLCARYVTQSGLASLQIGSLQLLGFQLGERFRYPLAASSPVDFWRRWNIYLGDWLREYAFVPLALQLRRTLPWMPHRAVAACSLLVTFALCGALHDVVALALNGRITLEASAFFAVQAVTVLTWSAAARKARSWPPMPRRLRAPLGWALTLHLAWVALLVGNTLRSASHRSRLELPASTARSDAHEHLHPGRIVQ